MKINKVSNNTQQYTKQKCNRDTNRALKNFIYSHIWDIALPTSTWIKHDLPVIISIVLDIAKDNSVWTKRIRLEDPLGHTLIGSTLRDRPVYVWHNNKLRNLHIPSLEIEIELCDTYKIKKNCKTVGMRPTKSSKISHFLYFLITFISE